MTYIVAPLVAWLVAGSLKFLLNSILARRLAFQEIGLGRLPSTHTTIVSTMAFLVGLREGFATPLFGIALTLAWIVILDAMDLRRRIEQQSTALNRLGASSTGWKPLRERIGHRPHEVLAGIVTGLACAYVLALTLP